MVVGNLVVLEQGGALESFYSYMSGSHSRSSKLGWIYLFIYLFFIIFLFLKLGSF